MGTAEAISLLVGGSGSHGFSYPALGGEPLPPPDQLVPALAGRLPSAPGLLGSVRELADLHASLIPGRVDPGRRGDVDVYAVLVEIEARESEINFRGRWSIFAAILLCASISSPWGKCSAMSPGCMRGRRGCCAIPMTSCTPTTPGSISPRSSALTPNSSRTSPLVGCGCRSAGVRGVGSILRARGEPGVDTSAHHCAWGGASPRCGLGRPFRRGAPASLACPAQLGACPAVAHTPLLSDGAARRAAPSCEPGSGESCLVWLRRRAASRTPAAHTNRAHPESRLRC